MGQGKTLPNPKQIAPHWVEMGMPYGPHQALSLSGD
jgi:hypothetical protein